MSNAFLESEVRQKIIEAIKKDLMGPYEENEILFGRPNVEYITGILSPDNNDLNYDDIDEVDFVIDDNHDSNKPEENEIEKDEKKLINTTSIGLSFYVEKNTKIINVHASWGEYISKKEEIQLDGLIDENSTVNKKEVVKYQREQMNEIIDFDLSKIDRKAPKKFTSNIEISILKYNLKSNYSLVSVFLTNKKPYSNDVSSYMFQVNLEVNCKSGFISESFARNNSYEDEYFYIEKPIFARGRGCAATWINDDLECHKISSSFIPEEEINKVSADFDEFESNFFSSLKFSISKNKSKNILDLKYFASKYKEWIDKLKASPKVKYFSNNLSHFYAIIDKCQKAHDRILEGIIEIENDETSYKAFELMNRIIYTQNAIKRYSKEHSRIDCSLEDFLKPDELQVDDFSKSKNKFCWRPFQLAFILLNIKSIVNPSSSDRKTVDLLYFPTGGGKTEAYLGLMAFTIANRRLRRNSIKDYNLDGGVTIILRYTLRLLTTQQRDRLTKMIIAAEYIRSKNPSLLGNERISIGFWVGDSVVSNNFIDFKPDNVGDTTNSEKKKRIAAKQLPNCPFCGKPLNYYSIYDDKHSQAENSFVFDVEKHELKVFCLDKTCFFTKYPSNGVQNSLPIYLVDEEIYSKCPTIVLGTVDKFATLPWNVKTNSLFGRVNRKCDRHGYIAVGDTHANKHNATKELPQSSVITVKKFLPPELIVQDELHLITGPLGTIYGGYETLIEKLCSYEIDGIEIQPKYIVSTATIKNAEEQIKSLYGRTFFQFPPSGLESSDSYFVREVPLEKSPFRKYLGICANGSSMKTTLLRTFAAALQEVKNLSLEPKYANAIDPYYTLVGYFNSIRELGGAARLLIDDIPDRIKRICKMHKYSNQRYLKEGNKLEITSRISSDKIKEELDLLETSVYNDKSHCIDTVIATNMIAVGMDVDRLGLMCVLGQPKQNSEYIQATSRIGRAHPGLVITLYNPYRPRDLSHYENFTAYHKQLYRYVEGTTATPFAARARDRFLHALIIIAIRLYYENMSQEPKNITLMSNEEIDDVVNIIVKRISVVDPSSVSEAKNEIKYFIDEWKNIVTCGTNIVYSGKYKEDVVRLMVPYSENHKSTEKGTLQSMRDVDQNSGLYLYKED